MLIRNGGDPFCIGEIKRLHYFASLTLSAFEVHFSKGICKVISIEKAKNKISVLSMIFGYLPKTAFSAALIAILLIQGYSANVDRNSTLSFVNNIMRSA